MKNLIFIISLFFLISSYSQDLSQPKGGGTLDIVLVSPGDGYSIMNFEGQISGYGSVFVKFNIPHNKIHSAIIDSVCEIEFH